jgi:hypothetical protein
MSGGIYIVLHRFVAGDLKLINNVETNADGTTVQTTRMRVRVPSGPPFKGSSLKW